MRETYSSLLQTARDLAVDPGTGGTNNLSTAQSFLASSINSSIQFLFNLTKNYKTQPLPKTMSTTADQIYYHNPPGLLSIQSMTMTVGSVNYPLKPISSQEAWDHLQQLNIASSAVPQYYFPRQSDFGIYPTPADSYTVTIVGNYLPQRLTAVDYTTGTVDVSQNSATVTGTSTTFTSAMVGRWFCEANSDGLPVGNWYRITSYASATSITLESVFEEASLSGATYIIGQSPELPEELHEYIPFRAASLWYSGPRRDTKHAQKLMNFFYTGDFENTLRDPKYVKGGVIQIIEEYKNKGRSNSALAHRNQSTEEHLFDDRWSVTLS